MKKLGFPTIKAPAIPKSKAVEAGQNASAFAFHPPTVPKVNVHMVRPHGGKGPHNG